MIIIKYVVLILLPFDCGMIEWFVEVVDALSTSEINGDGVGSLVCSIDDVVWMIDVVVRGTELGSDGRITGEFEGADVADSFNGNEGTVAVVGLSVDSIIESTLQVVNVFDIALGCSVIIFRHVSSV